MCALSEGFEHNILTQINTAHQNNTPTSELMGSRPPYTSSAISVKHFRIFSFVCLCTPDCNQQAAAAELAAGEPLF